MVWAVLCFQLEWALNLSQSSLNSLIRWWVRKGDFSRALIALLHACDFKGDPPQRFFFRSPFYLT